MPIDIVLTGNFSYCAEREFASVLEAAGTPFVAIHKENVRPPNRVGYWHHLYKERRGPFTGRTVLVYNDIERNLQIESGVAEPERIVITGMPRLDRVHRWRRQNAGPSRERTSAQVLFFAFARHEKLTGIQRKPSAGVEGNMEAMDGDWGKLGWNELGEGSHRAMVELARRRPDITVIIKTKGQHRKKDDILLMLKSAAETLPENVKVVAGGDPFPLMTQSRAVIGFNTTGLLEAIAAGKPVIVPWFGEAQDSAMRGHIIDLEDAVTYAQSEEDLIRLVTDLVDNPRDVPNELAGSVSRVLRYWVGNDDCAAGQRVHNAIKDAVDAEPRSRRLAMTYLRPKTWLKWILRIAATLNMPRFAAWLLARNLAPLPGLPAPASPGYRILVLNLNKPGFPADVAASFGDAHDVALVSWPTYALTSFSAALLSPELSNKRYSTDDPAIEATKERYRRFLLEVWQALNRSCRDRCRPHCQLRLLQSAGVRRRFAGGRDTLHRPAQGKREEPGAAQILGADLSRARAFRGQQDSCLQRHRTRAAGRGRRHRAANAIVVTGMPRLDRVHRWRREHGGTAAANPRQVLFFAFWAREKLTAYERVTDARLRVDSNEEWSKRNWNILCEGTYRAVIELARARPDIRVVLKTKPQSIRLDEVLKSLGEYGGELPANFTIVKGGDPIELIAESQVVIGFNSTALLEALAAGKPVIVPDFGEARDPAMSDLVIDLGERGAEGEFTRRFEAPCLPADRQPGDRSRTARPTAAKTLRDWVGNDDGGAGQRVLDSVKQEIGWARDHRAAPSAPWKASDSASMPIRQTS